MNTPLMSHFTINTQTSSAVILEVELIFWYFRIIHLFAQTLTDASYLNSLLKSLSLFKFRHVTHTRLFGSQNISRWMNTLKLS